MRSCLIASLTLFLFLLSVALGSVPDRGGRANELRAKPLTAGRGGGGGGGGRGGGGGGRKGGDNRGRGGRGGGHEAAQEKEGTKMEVTEDNISSVDVTGEGKRKRDDDRNA